MNPLPLPVRIAAGLVATAVEQAKDLPRLAVEFPVTAVSQALQASMRVQQKVTELAIKGDRALGSLRPVEEKPSWATFDDEEQVARNGSSTVTELRPQSARTVAELDEELVTEPPADTRADDATAVAADVTEAEAPSVDAPATAAAGSPGPAGDAATGPNALPGYGEMTIPQLRGRLRHLTVEDLRVLLDWETAHGNRPPFVTMLGNRITTVTEG